MIKLIIFDLDGVLVDAKDIHYEALNEALGPNYQISREEHLSTYDGLKTSQKLQMLTKAKGLPVDQYNRIWIDKQYNTQQALNKLTESQALITTMQCLIQDGYQLAVSSNSIEATVRTVLDKLGIKRYFTTVVANESVKNSKPHPEAYWKVMSELGRLPEETLIVEDSPYGLLAAHRSKAHVMRVRNSQEVDYNTISNFIQNLKQSKSMSVAKWADKKLNILIPMAGAGSRFEKAGYTFPKPLIEVNKKPMIQVVVENLNIEANYIYVVQKTHREKYNLDSLLNLLTPGCKIVEVDGLTEGAACTALLAKEYVNNDNPLFFANSDQFVEWDSSEFMYKMQETNADGGIVTFKATHPKWSFAEIDETSKLVKRVAEKNPISDIATVGYYYWKHGSDFVKYAEEMIEKDIRVNNEFYVCPVFNQAIEGGKKIHIFDTKGMWGLGTPEDLNFFLENYGK